jgi:hypothetical protein
MMDSGENQSPDALAQQIYTVTFWFENDGSETIKLYVEPWGEDYDLAPKEFLRLVARGPKAGCPIIYRHGANFVYSAWPRSVFAVYKNRKLMSWSLAECPPEPSPLTLDGTALETMRILNGEMP